MGAQKDGVCKSKSDFYTSLLNSGARLNIGNLIGLIIDSNPEVLHVFLNLSTPKRFQCRCFLNQQLAELWEHWNWTIYLLLDLNPCIYITIHRRHCAHNANVSSCWARRWGVFSEHGGCAAIVSSSRWSTGLTSQKGSSSVRPSNLLWCSVILCSYCEVEV